MVERAPYGGLIPLLHHGGHDARHATADGSYLPRPMVTVRSLVDRYVKERHDKGEVTRATARQLRSRLEAFAETVPADPSRVYRRHVDRWLATPGLSAHYRRARLSAVRGFCKWCVLNGHMRKDPTLGVQFAKLPPLLPRALNSEQAEALARIAHGHPRLSLVVSLMLNEGLRRAEVAAIQIGDIDRRAKILAVRGKGGGGEVTARLPITEETYGLLVRYLPTVPHASGPLLRSYLNPDKGISPQRVGEIVMLAMRTAGVKEYNGDGRSAHALRHTAAQDLVDAGVDMRAVQRVLRHASIRNTELYVRGEVKGLRAVMDGRRYFTESERS